ncbi:hypothetical protein [Pseudomonas aeruginosa]|uniref:hypothetical protein n=1 Tax=Pseudomonas aeruginosa TaxID=287 RepID=UPI00106D6DC4|nr:hypothetical protein [Pseudomonas aeruginosa]MBF8796408.1 hypothetical protein [Pseudomonas aeruginosa]HBN8507572.1 hypothetical protein [Pseudomonas aeruginosa]HCF2590784.1 hypothetical protein [Pseudomonas aeruginosa]HCL3481821.1 hypothetical protein [Pseudomonas aeruginosa]HEO1756122.1 hypothetical protein [Pseudomonas aeruginosa]
MNINRDRLSLVVLGLLLIVIAVSLSLNVSHDLAHFYGMAGLTLLVAEVLRFGDRLGVREIGLAGVVAGGLVLVCVVIVVAANRFGFITPAQGAFILTVLGLVLGLGYLARQLHQIMRPKHPAPVAALMVVSVSLIWEGVIQPFITVYGEAPRGYVQGWQVFADLSGVLLAYFASRKLGMHGDQSRPGFEPHQAAEMIGL